MANFYASYPFIPGGGGGGGSGTVISVGLADGSSTPIYTISNSPVTTTGTLTFALNSQSANLVFAGPGTGSAAQPTFRSLLAADIPTLAYISTTLGATALSGGLTVSVNTLSAAQSSGSQNGWLSSTDWTTFNAKGSGTVTAISIASANGFTGSSSGGATPALTIATSINSPVIAGDGTALIAATTTGSGSTAVLATAPTMTNPVVGTQTQGDASTKAASTAYVDTAVANAVAGINPAVAVQAATTAAGDTSGLTYNNGASGIGATFTGTNNTALTIDGFTFTALGQRLLVKNDTQSPSGAFNGIYSVTQVQASLLPPVLTRALDYDTPSDMNNTGAIPVINGTANGTTQWVLSSTVVTVGATPLTFTLFSKNPASYLLVANNLSDVATKATAFNNISPMTTGGDLIYGGSSGAGTRLANGSSGQVLTSQGTTNAPQWAAVGAGVYTVVSKTTTYLATSSDNVILCDDSGGSWTLTLPTAVGIAGRIYIIKKTNSGLSTSVTLATTSAQTIDGFASGVLLLNTQYETYQLVSDGANWDIVQHKTITNSASYTPTFTGVGTATAINAEWYREGQFLNVYGIATSGTVTGTAVSITIPSGLALNATLGALNIQFGTIQGFNTSASSTQIPNPSWGPWAVFTDGSSTSAVFMGTNVSNNTFTKGAGNTMNTGSTFTFNFKIPITGWTG